MLLANAAKLRHPQVLILNMTRDELFDKSDAHAFFDAIPGLKKRLMFWESDHNAWPDESIRQSIEFIKEHSP